jgi:hypothetical protein
MTSAASGRSIAWLASVMATLAAAAYTAKSADGIAISPAEGICRGPSSPVGAQPARASASAAPPAQRKLGLMQGCLI